MEPDQFAALTKRLTLYLTELKTPWRPAREVRSMRPAFGPRDPVSLDALDIADMARETLHYILADALAALEQQIHATPVANLQQTTLAHALEQQASETKPAALARWLHERAREILPLLDDSALLDLHAVDDRLSRWHGVLTERQEATLRQAKLAARAGMTADPLVPAREVWQLLRTSGRVIALSTIHSWGKQGIVSITHEDGRHLYRLSEVMAAYDERRGAPAEASETAHLRNAEGVWLHLRETGRDCSVDTIYRWGREEVLTPTRVGTQRLYDPAEAVRVYDERMGTQIAA